MSDENYITRSLMICTPYNNCLCDKIEKNEMGGECSTYGGEERCIQGFGGETWGKKTTWEDPDIDGRIILRNISGIGMWGYGLDLVRDRWWALVNPVMNLQIP